MKLETKFLHNFAVLFFLPSQVEFCLISGILFATELSFPASAIKVDCSLLLASKWKNKVSRKSGRSWLFTWHLSNISRARDILFESRRYYETEGVEKNKRISSERMRYIHICAHSIPKNCNMVTWIRRFVMKKKKTKIEQNKSFSPSFFGKI